MFMHTFIEDLKLPQPIGIQLVHHISGRILAVPPPPPTNLNDVDVYSGTAPAPGYTIVLDISHSTITSTARITSTFSRARLRSATTTFTSYLPATDTLAGGESSLLIATILFIVIGYHQNCSPIFANISSLLSKAILILSLLSLLYAASLFAYSSCKIRVSARRKGTFLDLKTSSDNKCLTSDSCCFFDVNFVVKFTVRALYAGTLVVDRTTAPPHLQPPRRNYYFHCQPYRTILVAALFFVLATLTIAARCYASTNGADSIVQLSPNPQLYTTTTTTTSSNIQLSTANSNDSYSRIHKPILTRRHQPHQQQQYSTSQLHTSNIVLSSLFKKPRKEILQSDISVIDETYSKLYSTNQNKRIRESYNINKASKRRIKRSSYHLDNNNNNKNIRKHDTTATAIAEVVKTSNQISYLEYRTKQSKKIFPHHPFTVDIYKDNVATTTTSLPSSSVTIANGQVTIPRIRTNTVVNKTSQPVIFSIASVQNKSAIHNNHSSVIVNKSTFHLGHQNNSVSSSSSSNTDILIETPQSLQPANKRPMPPGHGYTKDLLSESGGVLVLVAACLVLTLALGLVTCVLNHYRGGTVADPPDVAQTPTTAPMLSVVSAGATAGVGGMDRLRGRGAARELAANRDHQVRLHSVHTDIAINLPPSISLPDGEEHPFSSRLHLRDTEQESEIYQKCIRPPPNRTVLESESPPPYRSSSAGLLGSIGGSSSGSSNDWSGGSAPLVVRCHSMSTSSVSSTMKRPDAAGSSGQKTDFIQKTVKIFTGKKSQPSPAPTLPPVVIVPTRTRRTADQQHLHLNHNNHHHHQQHHHSSHLQHQQQPQQQNNNPTTGRPNSNV